MAKTTTSAYERGLLMRLGGGPDSVARVIERALDAHRPRPHYLVTPSAKLLVALHALLPGAIWERMLASTYPRPTT